MKINVVKTTKGFVLGMVMVFTLTAVSFAQEVVYGHKTTNFNITEEMVVQAQKAWAEALLKCLDHGRQGVAEASLCKPH